MIWNDSLYPPSGFVFTDSDGIEISGSTISDLVSKLAAYRTRRGLPPGNPLVEVHEYLCSRYPSRCLNTSITAPEEVSKPAGPSSSTRLTEWLRAVWVRMSNKTLSYVDEQTVKTRVEVCQQCSMQVRLPTECPACVETVDRLSFQLRAGRDKVSSGLKMCGARSSDLRVDVLLEQPADPNAPDNCWKRRL